MVKIEVGKVLDAFKVMSGSSDKGEYCSIIVKENTGKGHKQMKIWANNKPCNVRDGGKFRINKITEVRYCAKEFPKGSGKWNDEVVLSADVEAINIGAVGLNVDCPSWQEVDDDGQLPF